MNSAWMWYIEFLCYQGTVNVLSGHPRWMFRKNSIEFFVGLQPYLYYYYSGCTLEFHGHVSFPECSMVTWPCHMTWLTKTLFYLCLCSIVLLWRLLGWVFPCMGSLFLLEVLITHPLSSKSTPSRGVFYFLQYSCTFSYVECTSFLFYCTFCSLATCTASFSLLFFFSTSIFGYFHLRCPTLQHLKYFTFSVISCLLTFTSSLTLQYITLLAITSNLFWRISFSFFSHFLFLQLQARCPNLLYLQHTLPPFLSISALSLARACH